MREATVRCHGWRHVCRTVKTQTIQTNKQPNSKADSDYLRASASPELWYTVQTRTTPRTAWIFIEADATVAIRHSNVNSTGRVGGKHSFWPRTWSRCTLLKGRFLSPTLLVGWFVVQSLLIGRCDKGMPLNRLAEKLAELGMTETSPEARVRLGFVALRSLDEQH